VSGVRLDLTHWPILLCCIEGDPTLDDVDEFLAAYEERVMTRTDPFACVVEMSGLTRVPSARLRGRAARWARSHQNFAIQQNRGLAIVAPNPIARAVMKTLLWVVPAPVPTSFEPDLTSAVRVVAYRLATSGIDVAPLEPWLAGTE